ncbi:MAG: outer rane chaperone Skp (OmpH) [Deltaproteobacteria bacterium]|nr:outer rane chaperone Skp (OmpH) [Deltaproteobacteria bacterium]
MKYWLLVIALALIPSVVSAQAVKIGFIDIQRVIAESAAGKRAKDRFQAQVKKAEADIQKERIDLERLKADIEKKGPLLKDEERRTLEGDFQKRSVTLQRTMGDYQQDLQQKEREMMGDILKDLEQIVSDLGKAEKFTFIFEKSQILYSDASTDITHRVVETYNSRAKK